MKPSLSEQIAANKHKIISQEIVDNGFGHGFNSDGPVGDAFTEKTPIGNVLTSRSTGEWSTGRGNNGPMLNAGGGNGRNVLHKAPEWFNASGDFIIPEKDIRAYNTIIIDNNRAGVIGALNKNGYKLSIDTRREQLGAILFGIYKSNKPKYTNIVQAIDFNPHAKNYTTEPKILAQIGQYLKELQS